MVIDKLLEYFQDLKRYYDDKKWGKFYDNYRNDPEEYEMYDIYFHNSYDDYEEAARDLCSEIREYMDLVWNEIPEDQVKSFDDDEKHNVREWLDETSRMFWNKLDNFSEHETYGFLLQGYKMLKWIENAARKTPDEFYGKYTSGQMPYYLGESLGKGLGQGLFDKDSALTSKSKDDIEFEKFSKRFNDLLNDDEGWSEPLKCSECGWNPTYSDDIKTVDEWLEERNIPYCEAFEPVSRMICDDCFDELVAKCIIQESTKLTKINESGLYWNRFIRRRVEDINELYVGADFSDVNATGGKITDISDLGNGEVKVTTYDENFEEVQESVWSNESLRKGPGGYGMYFRYGVPEKMPKSADVNTPIGALLALCVAKNDSDVKDLYGSSYMDELYGEVYDACKGKKETSWKELAQSSGSFLKENVRYAIKYCLTENKSKLTKNQQKFMKLCSKIISDIDSALGISEPANNIKESKDYTYIAKIGKGWLKGHDIVYDKKEADSFESETEPTQRINQMKKDGKISKGTYTSVIKETTTMKKEDGIIRSLYEAVAEDEDWEYDDSDEIMSDDITDEDFIDEGSPYSYPLQKKVMDDDIESAIADTMPTRKPAKKLPYKSTDFPERDVTKHSFIDDEGFIKDVKMFNDRDYYDRTKAKELEKNPNADTEFYDKHIDWYDSHPEDDYLKFVNENDDTVYYPEDDDCPDSSEYAEYFDARSPRRKGGYAHSDVTDFSATKNFNWRDKSYTMAGPYAMTSFQSVDTYDKSGPEEVEYDPLKESKNDDIPF